MTMFGFVPLRAKDYSMKWGDFQCVIRFSRFNRRFQEAQVWLDKTLMSLMYPVIPYRTGKFLGKLININASKYGTGKLTVVTPPQGRYLYRGVAPSGRPIHYTNPRSVPYWGMATWNQNKVMLMDGVRQIVRGGGSRGR